MAKISVGKKKKLVCAFHFHPTRFLINEAVTGNGAKDLTSFALQIQGRVLPFSVLKCLLSEICICSNCSRATALQMLLCKIWNYLRVSA